MGYFVPVMSVIRLFMLPLQNMLFYFMPEIVIRAYSCSLGGDSNNNPRFKRAQGRARGHNEVGLSMVDLLEEYKSHMRSRVSSIK